MGCPPAADGRLLAAPRGLHGDVASPDDERACVRAGQSESADSDGQGDESYDPGGGQGRLWSGRGVEVTRTVTMRAEARMHAAWMAA